MEEKKISTAVIKRLPRYYRYLGDLMQVGIERISSKDLSKIMKVTASQIRQDLNNFGGFGQQGYGYNVAYLRDEIAKILNLDESQNIIIIGAGNIGKALAKYDFENVGFNVVGIFDINEAVIGKMIKDIEVKSLSYMEEFVEANDIRIAVLAIPRDFAPAVAKRIENMGIKAILNFAPIDLNLDREVAVRNIHIDEALMQLSYNYHHIDDQM